MQFIKVALFRWYYRWANRRAWKTTDFSDISSRDMAVGGEAGELPARLYQPKSIDDGAGLVVYFHGGGWVIGDLETHDGFCRRLTQDTGNVVLAIDYRLAPEAVYPAAALDCIAATRWAIAHRVELGTGSGPLIVAGDSAGANLSAVVAQQLGAELDGQCLIYPVTRHYEPPTQSYLDNATGYVLTLSVMQWFWDSYYPLNGEPLTADNVPLAVLEGVSPRNDTTAAMVITAQHDPLLDEGNAYAAALQQAGIACEHHYYPGEQHGFVCSEGRTGGHNDAMEKITRWMKSLPAAGEPA